MNRAEYKELFERLQRGEPVEMTPAQAASFRRAATLEQVREGVKAARREPQPLSADTLGRLLCRYGDNFGVWSLFTRIVQGCKVTPDAFGAGLRQAYTMGHADRNTALSLFRFADPRATMNADDYAAREDFPERLKIYRGCDIEEHNGGVYGLSWTTAQVIAEFFAWRFDPSDRSRVVVSCEIPRGDVLAYFNDRKERETIADVRALSCTVKVVATEPTPLYWDYMERR